MAYVDLTTSFVYKSLLTYQLMDALAENDKVFNDLLTAVTDFNNFLQFNNTFGLKGEVAAGGSYKKLIVLDSSNVVQLGESGIEVRVPADPTNNLGVATKAYVDGVQMFQTQPKVSASTGASSSYATILSLSATTRGRVKSLAVLNGTSNGVPIRIRITIDGGTPVVIDSTNVAASRYRYLQANLTLSTADITSEDDASHLIDIAFNTSLLVEATIVTGNAGTAKLVYEKIP